MFSGGEVNYWGRLSGECDYQLIINLNNIVDSMLFSLHTYL